MYLTRRLLNTNRHFKLGTIIGIYITLDEHKGTYKERCRRFLDTLKNLLDLRLVCFVVQYSCSYRFIGKIIQFLHLFPENSGWWYILYNIYSVKKKITYDLRFFIASSAAVGIPITTVLSKVRSLFAVPSSRCASSSSLSPTA